MAGRAALTRKRVVVHRKGKTLYQMRMVKSEAAPTAVAHPRGVIASINKAVNHALGFHETAEQSMALHEGRMRQLKQAGKVALGAAALFGTAYLAAKGYHTAGGSSSHGSQQRSTHVQQAIVVHTPAPTKTAPASVPTPSPTVIQHREPAGPRHGTVEALISRVDGTHPGLSATVRQWNQSMTQNAATPAEHTPRQAPAVMHDHSTAAHTGVSSTSRVAAATERSHPHFGAGTIEPGMDRESRASRSFESALLGMQQRHPEVQAPASHSSPNAFSQYQSRMARAGLL